MNQEPEFRQRLRQDAERLETDFSEVHHDVIMRGILRAQKEDSVPEKPRFGVFSCFSIFSVHTKMLAICGACLLAVAISFQAFRPETGKMPGGSPEVVIIENEKHSEIALVGFPKTRIRPATVLGVIFSPVSLGGNDENESGKTLSRLVPCQETLSVLAEISGVSGVSDGNSPPESSENTFWENSEYREFFVKASEVMGESFAWVMESENYENDF